MTKNIGLIKIHHGHSFNFEFMNDFHYKKSMLHRSTGCKFPCHPLIVFSVESSRPTTMVFNILHTPYHPSTHTTQTYLRYLPEPQLPQNGANYFLKWHSYYYAIEFIQNTSKIDHVSREMTSSFFKWYTLLHLLSLKVIRKIIDIT